MFAQNVKREAREKLERPSLARIPKPYPDRDAGHYFSVAVTPTANSTVDDCLPRVQMKRLFEEEEEEEININKYNGRILQRIFS